MVFRSTCTAFLIALLSAPVLAGPNELNYPEGSLGFAALMSADYATAENQLRKSRGVAPDDPARLINLGVVLIRTGREAEGVSLLEKAAKGENFELVMADGRSMSSKEVARRALAKLKRNYAGR